MITELSNDCEHLITGSPTKVSIKEIMESPIGVKKYKTAQKVCHAIFFEVS